MGLYASYDTGLNYNWNQYNGYGSYNTMPAFDPTGFNSGCLGYGYDYGYGYGYGCGYTTSGSSISSGDTSTSGNIEDIERARKKERKEKDQAEDKIQEERRALKAQKNILENGASIYTTTITDPQSGTAIEVYADKNGNALKFKVDENGQIVVGKDGKPVEDPNGMMMPVNDLKNSKKDIKELKDGKNADGTTTVSMSAEEYRKKVPWWKRAGRAVGHAFNGVFKMAKGFLGFDEKGNWNPKKALTNAAVLAAGIAVSFIPGVGQIVGPALLYAGLGMGAWKVGEGIYKSCNAETVDEIDKAYEDIGQGIATIITSRCGIKNMGKNVLGTEKFNTFKDAPNLFKAQITNTRGLNWKQQIKYNYNNINPFRSKAKADLKANTAELQKAQSEYTRINNWIDVGMGDETLLARGIELEGKINNLQTAVNNSKAIRMHELATSPTKWLSKSNRTAIRSHYDKGLIKSYWHANTAGKTWKGKAWFATKKTVGTGLTLSMPEFIVYNPLAASPTSTGLKFCENFIYTQKYEAGLLDAFIAPESVINYTKEETEERYTQLTEQEKRIKENLKDIDEALKSKSYLT